jgi:hypothetical protein
LDDVLQVADELIATRIPVHTLEQLAFSYVLQHKTTLHSSHQYILHYWLNKVVWTKMGTNITDEFGTKI